MIEDTPIPGPLNNVIRIDDERIKGHLDRVVRGTVEETLNSCSTPRRTGCAMRSATSAPRRVAIPGPVTTSAVWKPRPAK